VPLDEAIDEQRFKCTRYMRDLVIAAAASGACSSRFNVDLPASGHSAGAAQPELAPKFGQLDK
jgi:hypothetical protein